MKELSLYKQEKVTTLHSKPSLPPYPGMNGVPVKDQVDQQRHEDCLAVEGSLNKTFLHSWRIGGREKRNRSRKVLIIGFEWRKSLQIIPFLP